MLTHVIVPLLVTLLVEVPIVAWVFKQQRRRMALVAALTTGATNLTMNTLWRGVAASYGSYLIVGELGALLIEAAVYAAVSRPRELGKALVASAIANAASYGTGEIIWALAR